MGSEVMRLYTGDDKSQEQKRKKTRVVVIKKTVQSPSTLERTLAYVGLRRVHWDN